MTTDTKASDPVKAAANQESIMLVDIKIVIINVEHFNTNVQHANA